MQTNQYLECVIETNPDALDIAANLDQERKDGRVRGPLHGIPVLVKDVSTPSCHDPPEQVALSTACLTVIHGEEHGNS